MDYMNGIILDIIIKLHFIVLFLVLSTIFSLYLNDNYGILSVI